MRNFHAEITKPRTGAFRRDARRWKVIEAYTPSRNAVAVVTTIRRALKATCSTNLAGSVRRDSCHTGDARPGRLRPARPRRLSRPVSKRTFPKIEWEASVEDLQAFGLCRLRRASPRFARDDAADR